MSESEMPDLKLETPSATSTNNELKISKLFRRSPSPSPAPSSLPTQNKSLMVQSEPFSPSSSDKKYSKPLHSSSSATGKYLI